MLMACSCRNGSSSTRPASVTGWTYTARSGRPPVASASALASPPISRIRAPESLPAAARVPAEASHSASFSTVAAMPSPVRTARSWAGSSTAVETVGPDQAGKRFAFGEADRDGQRAVAEDVAFRAQSGDVLRGAELFGPGAGVGGERPLQRCEFLGGQEALGRVLNPADAGVDGSSGRGAGGGAGLADPFAEADKVVRAAGLGAGADGGFLPAAEGLALDNRAGDAAVDVEVAGLDGVQPDPQFLAVQRVQARGEAVFDLVLDRDGLLEGLCRHNAQDRAEELGEVEVGSAADTGAHAGAPELARIIELARLDGPGLALAEGGEGVQELAVGGLDDRAHLARRVLRVADLQRGDGVDELVVEALRLRHGADEDHQRGGGALLAGVAERGVRDVLGREVQVRARGDDDGVLAAGLGQQGQVLAERAEQLGGLVAAGEDDAVHGRVGNELLPQFPLAQLDHGE